VHFRRIVAFHLGSIVRSILTGNTAIVARRQDTHAVPARRRSCSHSTRGDTQLIGRDAELTYPPVRWPRFAAGLHTEPVANRDHGDAVVVLSPNRESCVSTIEPEPGAVSAGRPMPRELASQVCLLDQQPGPPAEVEETGRTVRGPQTVRQGGPAGPILSHWTRSTSKLANPG